MMSHSSFLLPWQSAGWLLCFSATEMGMRGSLYSWGARTEHVIGGSWHQTYRNFNVKVAMHK